MGVFENEHPAHGHPTLTSSFICQVPTQPAASLSFALDATQP